MPLSKLLSIPFAILMMVFLYLAWKHDSAYAPYILVGLLPLALLYIMSAEVDWWWYERNPPEIEPNMADVMDRAWPPYQQMDQAGKKLYRQKVAMFIHGTQWVPQVWESIPRDVQVAIAAQAVLPLMRKPQWLYPDYETVVVYPRGFMSPDFPYTHNHELNQEDKCLIFNAEHVMRQFMFGELEKSDVVYEYCRVGLLTRICTRADVGDWAVASQITDPAKQEAL